MKNKIYLITNNLRNKHYVGYTSVSIEERLIAHLCAAKTGSMYFIHQSIRKHGWENFSIKTIYESDDADHTLKIMEPLFIKEYNSYGPHGYNMTLGGEGSSGPCSLEKAANISKAKKGMLTPWTKGNTHSKNYIWVTNRVDNIRLHKDALIPENYHRGRTLGSPNRTKLTIRPKFLNGYKPSTKPRKPITQDHIQNISKSLIGNTRAAGNHNVAGRIWINNGSINKRVDPSSIPEGFIKGKI